MSEMRDLNTRFESKHFEDAAQWEAYASWLARHIRVSLGLLPEPERTPLHAEVFGKWSGDGYSCEKACFESLPGLYVTGNLFRPLNEHDKACPVVLCPHGHWPDGRLHDRDPRGSVIARCIQLARMGAVVFSHDMVGYNDSCGLPHRDFDNNPPFGLSLMALQTWNSIRAVDFLLSLPRVDGRRIGVTGASGGGTQTFILSAVDSRITASAPVCMISFYMQGGCNCENAPLLRLDASNVDIARLAAPKPLFMGSCTGDWTKNTGTDEFPAVREIYRLYNESELLLHSHVDEEHNYNRELREHVYGFFHRFLFGGDSTVPIPETNAERPPHRERMVWWGRSAPQRINQASLSRMWRDHIDRSLSPYLRSAESVREHLGPLLAHTAGITGTSIGDFLKREPESVSFKKSNQTVAVHERKPLQYPREEAKYFTTYNRTPFADRVHEILGVLRNSSGDVRLVGNGNAGPAVIVAAALSQNVKSVEADLCGFDAECDEHWSRYFDLPSIRRIGGFAIILAMIGRREMNLTNASDSVIKMKRLYAF